MLVRHPHVRLLTEVRLRRDAVKAVAKRQPDVTFVPTDGKEEPIIPLVAQLHAASQESAIVVVGDVMDHQLEVTLRRTARVERLAWRDVTDEKIEAVLLAIQLGLSLVSEEIEDIIVTPPGAWSHLDVEGVHLSPNEEAALRALARDLPQKDLPAVTSLSKSALERAISDAKEDLHERALRARHEVGDVGDHRRRRGRLFLIGLRRNSRRNG
jgi:hypothetical protein